jgi:hypothetical protein
MIREAGSLIELPMVEIFTFQIGLFHEVDTLGPRLTKGLMVNKIV